MAEQHMENQGQAQEDVNHLLKVRREKLAELQAAGKDPFAVTRYEVTAHSGEIKEQYEQLEGKEGKHSKSNGLSYCPCIIRCRSRARSIHTSLLRTEIHLVQCTSDHIICNTDAEEA